MAYLIDRQRALRTEEIVVILKGMRRARSRVVLSDNSLYQTLTRPQTLVRYLREAAQTFGGLGGRSKGAIWWKQR